MIKTLFFSLFFVSFISIHAQSTLISGKIIVDDADEVINLNGFVIENSTTNTRTKANENGLFSIKVNEGDELIFKQIGIINRQLKISKNMLNRGFIEVHVNVEVIELAETNISKLNKDMLNNLGKNKMVSTLIIEATGINDEAFKKVVVDKHNWADFHRKANPYAGNLLEIVKFFKKANGKGILDKKRISTYEKINNLKSVIGETFFIKYLNVSRDKIIDFIGNCYYTNNFEKLIRKRNFEGIKQILKEQAPIYLSKIKENE